MVPVDVIPLNVEGQLSAMQFFRIGIPPSQLSAFISTYWLLDQSPEASVSFARLDPLVVAYDCNFHFCIQSFEATTKNGTAKQHRTGTATAMRLDPSGTTTWVFHDIPAAMNNDNASAYLVSGNDMDVVSLAFSPVISGNASVSFGNPISLNGLVVFNQTGDIGQPPIVLSIGGPVLEAFYYASDSLAKINALCDQMADTLTTWMRDNLLATEDKNGKYAPTVYADEMYVQVRCA